MNILYMPQLSMYDKNAKKFLPEADGNLNMMRNFINEWLIHRPKDNFITLLPFRQEITKWFDNTWPMSKEIISLFYENYVISARINRYNFPMEEFESQIKWLRRKIDLVICDIPELSRNIKAMFSIYFGYEPRIVSNIRHIDDPSQEKTSYDYMWRIIDGIECSDYCTILSETMHDMLINELDNKLNWRITEELMKKIIVFEPSISSKELESHNPNFYVNEKKIITFPGRLSVGEEQRTNWDKFFDAILELREKRQDFEVYFTDPNNSLLFKNKVWIKTIDRNRKEYIQLIAKTDIIVSLMAIQGFGGISIREALYFGCYPVIPCVGEYRKMAYTNHKGFIDEITVENIKDALNNALDNFSIVTITQAISRSTQFTIEYQMPKLLEKIGGILHD